MTPELPYTIQKKISYGRSGSSQPQPIEDLPTHPVFGGCIVWPDNKSPIGLGDDMPSKASPTVLLDRSVVTLTDTRGFRCHCGADIGFQSSFHGTWRSWNSPQPPQ
ncbi:hypothetical protein RISK_000586 [Rhodopirellula islandica]|uniref:Uncharacterized protein n=1 Tax=Rhodopirellula islandica TaxID=595434 RepID=A0A0J1BM26_RHOIS|nr:hypothetical protein RISK_000586 [Rhodopirellula islandica]